MRLDQIVPANADALPLPGGERVGVRGDGPSIVLSPLTRFATGRCCASPGANRPLPTGERLNRTRRPTDSIRSHPALAKSPPADPAVRCGDGHRAENILRAPATRLRSP